MSDRLARLLADAASLSVADETPPFAVSSPSEALASPAAAAASARVVGVGGGGVSAGVSEGKQGRVSSGKSYSVMSVRGDARTGLCMGVMSKTGQLGICVN